MKKIGILINGNVVDYYNHLLIKMLEDLNDVEVIFYEVTYRNEINESLNSKIYSKLIDVGVPKLIRRFVLRLLLKIIKICELTAVKKIFPKANRLYQLRSKTKKLNCKFNHRSNRIDASATAIKKIHNDELTLLLRLNSEIIQGELLNVAKFGIISFHHGDNRINRGGPAGFWEAFNNEPSIGFIIQRLNNELDGGEILFRGNIMAEKLWLINHANIRYKSNVFMYSIIKDIFYNDRVNVLRELAIHHKRYLTTTDRPILLLKYITKVYTKILLNKIKRKIFLPKRVEWNIAFKKSDGFKTSLSKFKTINNQTGHFFADPFIIKNNEKNICFVEEYNYDDGKGAISAILLQNGSYSYIGKVLQENFHLSFPFVFVVKNEIYMIPETSEINEIRLYKCVEFPTKWAFSHTLMNNVAAADSILIFENNLWFLLTNICSSNMKDFNSELHIFYTKNLYKPNWTPISSGNPVIFDSTRARNGGVFLWHGKLYRVNQVQGNGHYGKAFDINEIVTINKDHYLEVKASSVTSDFITEATSTHHFSYNSDFTVIDYAKTVSFKDNAIKRIST